MRRRLFPCIAAALALAVPASAEGSTVFTLTGHGWGHGIGMSQYGALGYAQHGWGYRQMMAHYFTDTRVAPLGGSVLERVLLSSGRAAHFGASSGMTLRDAAGASLKLAAGSYTLQPGGTNGHLQLVTRSSGAVKKGLVAPVQISPGSQPLRLDDSAGIGFAGDHWHGTFRVAESGGSLLVIDLVGLEKYLRGVVPSEMPASWPLPALKAQAVAARSYAVSTRRPSDLFDAYADTRSQVFGPIEHEASASSAAVAGTDHQVVWYKHSVATTFFSSSSGGRTSSEQAAWDTTLGQPYLVPVTDRYDNAGGANPNHTWKTQTYGTLGLARALGLSGVVASVTMKIDGPSQRVLSMDVTSSGGTSTLSGATVQVRMGLRSTYFRLLQRTLKTATHNIVAGTTITLTGRAAPVPTHGLSLQRRTGAGTAWTTAVRSLHVGAKGNFVVRLTPTADRSYRLASAGDAVSPRINVAVAPKLALAVSGGRFRATTYPELASATLILERHTLAGWKVVESGVAGAHGRVAFATAPKAGQWRVHFGGDSSHSRGNSPVLTRP